MASAPQSPLAGLVQSQLIKRLAGGAGATPDAAGQQLSSQFSELNNADPAMGSNAAKQIKSMLVAMVGKYAFEVPEASRHAAQALKSIDAMIKALEQGAATQKTIGGGQRQQTPGIQNNAGLPSPNMQPGSEPQPGEGAM